MIAACLKIIYFFQIDLNYLHFTYHHSKTLLTPLVSVYF